MRRVLSALAVAVAALLLAVPPVRAAEPLVVVELFTSQGCSSCPPADALLGELAKEDHVLALSQHVDYWDYLGWQDPFARADATLRQRSYALRFGLSYVYTPQMVIQGEVQVTGSDAGAVRRAVAARRSRDAIDIAIRPLPGERIEIAIGERPGVSEADVWLVFYDRRHTTAIGRGENRGRTLAHHNVVRSLARIGSWSGAPLTLPVHLNGMDGLGEACAVLVQEPATGRIHGAARLHLSDIR